MRGRRAARAATAAGRPRSQVGRAGRPPRWRARRAASPARRRQRAGQRRRVAGRHQEGAAAVVELLAHGRACRPSRPAGPAAIACQTLFGTTRAALALVPKTPRQIAAAPELAPSALVGHPALPGEAGRRGRAPARPPATGRAGRRRSARTGGDAGRAGRLEHGRDAVERGELAVEERAPAGRRAAGRDGKRLGLRAHRHHRDPRRAGTPKRAASQSAPAAVSARTRSASRQRQAVDARPAPRRSPGRRGRGRPPSVSASEIIMSTTSGTPAGPRDAPGRDGVGLGGVAGHDRVDPPARARPRGARPGPGRGDSGRPARAQRHRGAGRRRPCGAGAPTPAGGARPPPRPISRRPRDQHPRARVVPLVGAEPHRPCTTRPGPAALSG